MPKPRKPRFILLSDLAGTPGTVHVEVNITSVLFWGVRYTNDAGATFTIDKNGPVNTIELGTPASLKGSIDVFQIGFVPDANDERKYHIDLTWKFRGADGSEKILIESFADTGSIPANDPDPIIVCSVMFM